MSLLDYARDKQSVHDTSQTFANITDEALKRINEQQALNVFLSINPNVRSEAMSIDERTDSSLLLKGMTIP